MKNVKTNKKSKIVKLPKPKNRRGYTDEEILKLCKDLSININKFWKAFGVNTVGLSKDLKTRYYYPVDVEKALWNLGHKLGKWHQWD